MYVYNISKQSQLYVSIDVIVFKLAELRAV